MKRSTVERSMPIIILDIECIENNIIKELGVYKDGKIKGYSFLCPKKFKATKQSLWLSRNLHGINWKSGNLPYTELKSILNQLKTPETEFFAKGLEKCKILSNLLQQSVDDLEELGCPKVQFLVFRNNDGTFDEICNSYPCRHSKSLHCAQRKAFAYGQWTEKYFLNDV